MTVGLQAMNFAVNAVTSRDESDWLSMRRLLWPNASAEEHRAEIGELRARAEFAAFVARDGAGAALGFAELYVRPFANGCASRPVPFLEGIWVAPPERGRGVGRALLVAVEAWCRAHGHTELGSDAQIDNEGSHRAHSAWGFAETERVVYFRKPLPALEAA
jgi:aminoglycoside 6'-N-acetyltransferase I